LPDHQSRTAPCGDDDPPGFSIVRENENPAPESRQTESQEQPKDSINEIDRLMVKWTRAVALLTGALFIAALLQFCAMKGQQTVMQGQLDSMEVDQRPWLGVSSVVAVPDIISPGKDFTARITIKNTGRSPASKWAFIGGPRLVIQEATKFESIRLQHGRDAGFLPPNGEFTIDVGLDGKALTGSLVKRIMSKQDIIYLFARTDFIDNLNKKRCLHICMQYGPDVKRFGYCPDANLIDQYCE
jgi:hypothetical protein